MYRQTSYDQKNSNSACFLLALLRKEQRMCMEVVYKGPGRKHNWPEYNINVDIENQYNQGNQSPRSSVLDSHVDVETPP